MSDRFNNENSEPEINQTAPESPGSMLNAAREQAGLSQESIADQLNISVAKVRALETDQYDKLASEVFAQGYLRRYSKLVGVDEEMLVERFRQWSAENRPETKRYELQRPAKSRSQLPAGVVLVVLAGVILLVLAFFLFGTGDEPSAPAPEPASEQRVGESREQTTTEPIENNDAAWDPLPSQDDPIPVEAEPDRTVEPAPQQTPQTILPSSPAQEPTPEEEAAIADVLSTVTVDSEETVSSHLRFAFTEECWVEVRDASGEILRAEVANAGESFALEGEAPFSVMLGNARAASVSYQGEPVTINTPPGNRTARLTVGP